MNNEQWIVTFNDGDKVILQNRVNGQLERECEFVRWNETQEVWSVLWPVGSIHEDLFEVIRIARVRLSTPLPGSVVVFDSKSLEPTESESFDVQVVPSLHITRPILHHALGRVSDVTNPDGTHLTKSYTSRAVLVTDASGIQKAFQNDGLGRLHYVCDGIGAGTQANGATTSSCGLDTSASGFLATYGENAMGNLTSVNFSGQTRSFAYDGLSRMTSETNPESGTITYVYDSGTPGDLYTRTFPKPNASSGTVTATYSWDAMHRPTGITFSDGSSGYAYVYDASSLWGATLLNPKGRLVEQSHTGGAAAISTVMISWAELRIHGPVRPKHAAHTHGIWGTPTIISEKC